MTNNSAYKRYEPYPKCVSNPIEVMPSTSKTISNSEKGIKRTKSQGN